MAYVWPPKLGSQPLFLGGSGFTPVDDYIPIIPRSGIPDPDQAANDRRVRLQKDALFGFTTQELVHLDIITERALRPGNLQLPIHPLLLRERWETQPPCYFERQDLYPLPDSLSGNCKFWMPLSNTLVFPDNLYVPILTGLTQLLCVCLLILNFML